MASLRAWLIRFWSSLRPRRSDEDLEAELRHHLELAAEREGRGGATAEAARRAAGIREGQVAASMEPLRDQRGLPWLHDLSQDLRYGLRGLVRSPLFAGVIILSLALGIGANTALFSLIDASFLRDVPVEQPDRLVQLRWRSRNWTPDRLAGVMVSTFSGEHYSPAFPTAAVEVFRERAGSLGAVIAYGSLRRSNTVVSGRAGRVTSRLVSANFFGGLGLAPSAGRLFVTHDDDAFDTPGVVISYRYWTLQFDRDPAIVGFRMAVDGVDVVVLGVAPESFRMSISRASGSVRRIGGVAAPDVWIPLGLEPLFGSRHGVERDWWLSVVGRMAPGVTPEQVEANLDGAVSGMVSEWEGLPTDATVHAEVVSARRGAPEAGLDGSVSMVLTLGVVLLALLLIVCLNVANLLLSRGASRRPEISIRLAMGASRRRLVRQLLTEHMTLALCAGALGLVAAWWGGSLFAAVAVVSPDLDLRIDARVLGVAIALSIATGLLFGLLPALRATQIREGRTFERLEVAGAPASMLNRALLVAQVAVSIVLLGGAALFAQSLGPWSAGKTGFNPSRLLVFQLEPEAAGYDPAVSMETVERVLTRIRSKRGVTAVTASGPFWEAETPGTVSVPASDIDPVSAGWMPVRHDFFDTLELALVAGRGFTDVEDRAPPGVAIVDDALAEALFGESMPLGRHVEFKGRSMQIVGVAERLWMPGPRLETPRPMIYLPYSTRLSDFPATRPSSRSARQVAPAMSVLVRTAGEPMPYLPVIQSAVREVAVRMPLLDEKTVEQGIAERLGPTQVTSLIWLSFGAMALVLTAVGLYGILAGNVARRTREIGIRTALGADRIQIIRLVAGETAALVLIGIGLGTFGSHQANEMVRAVVFGISPANPATMAVVAGLVVVVTACAAFVPSRRALRLNPTAALRSGS